MTRNKKWIGFAIAVVLIAALATTMTLRRPSSRALENSAEKTSLTTGARVRWPIGERLIYSLVWRAQTAGQVAPGSQGQQTTSLNLEASIEADIALERAGGTEEAPVVALSYLQFKQFSLDMQGQDAKPQVEQVNRAVAGQAAFLSIDDRGRISTVAFAPEMDSTSRSLLRSLALQLGYSLPGDDETNWEADEANSLGEAHVRYRRSGRDLAREPFKLTRLDLVTGPLDGAQNLTGGALIALDGTGRPLSIEETIDASYTRPGESSPAVHSSWSFQLARKSVGASDPKLLAAATRAVGQPLGHPIFDPERAHRRDARLSQPLSNEDVLAMFDQFETGAKPRNQFLVRAAAYLRLHPEALPAVLHSFEQPTMTARGRGFILDVLAATGSAKAQETMRRSLSTPQARAKSGDYAILIQRFTFVTAPDAETIQFLETSYANDLRSGDGNAAQGTAVTLGATVRRLTAQGQVALANQVNDKLREDLRGAKTPEMRGALVAALGNAARKEDVADLAAVAADPDRRVRDQVAGALGHIDSPESRSALFGLAADSASGVAMTAFQSLQDQTLADADWQSLAQIAESKSSPVNADPALLTLVRSKDHGLARPESKQILTAMAARNHGTDNDLTGILQGLLSREN